MEPDFEEEEYIEIIPALSEEESNQLMKQNFDRVSQFYHINKKYEIQYWYDALKDYTAPSFCLPLTSHEAYILHLRYYEQNMTTKDEEVNEGLKKKVEQLLNSKRENENENFFMKLSTRSPKDYCWDYRGEGQVEKAGEKLAQFLNTRNVNKETQKEELNNFLYKFFLLQSKQKLSIKNCLDFIEIFGKSDRIITDINDFSLLEGNVFTQIKQGNYENSDKEMVKIWVRKWRDCQWYEEFRVFYHNYKPTAISQYDEKCYFTELQGIQEELKVKVQAFFQSVKPKLKQIDLGQGVMDLIIKENSIEIIEINAFSHNARASLFDWKEDKELLENGPLTVRILEKKREISGAELASMMGMIDKKTEDVIKYGLGKLGIAR